VRLIDHIVHSDAPVAIGHVVLVGVDPKIRLGAQDTQERHLGIESAFDEATQLWEDVGSAGRAFTETLNNISRESDSMRLVLCASDGIAERKNNVDQLVGDCINNDRIDIIEAIDRKHIDACNISVNLTDDSYARAEVDVHFRLWPAVSVHS